MPFDIWAKSCSGILDESLSKHRILTSLKKVSALDKEEKDTICNLK